MKRRISLFVLLTFAAVAASAQVRALVPVVRPVLHERTKDFIVKLADSMSKEGYRDAAEYLRAWSEGGFGSGMVYVDPATGRNYAITNRHVVAQAERVTLEFDREDGSTAVYKDCRVVAVSENLDLALVAFPDDARPFKSGLPISTALPADGVDAWSAGFPGLLSRPSWQFGKGSVTNRAARIPELADPEETALIQHSAPIDPGSSGGPLLVASASSPLGYAVVGVNTWKVGGRQDTNFAIPSSAIEAFLKTATSRPAGAATERLADRARAFVAAASQDDYKRLVRFVSYEIVAKEGERLLKAALASAPTKIRNEIVEQFVSVSPIDGLRMAVAYAIAERASISPLALAATDAVAADDGTGYADMLAGQTPFRAAWIEEHGHWRLASFPPAAAAQEARGKAAQKASVGVDIVSPFDLAFAAGAVFRIDGERFTALNFGMQADIFNSQFIHFSFEGAAGSMPYQSYDGERKATVFIPRVGLVFQLPIRMREWYAVPFGKANVGFLMPLSLDGPDMGFHASWGAGAYVGVPGTNVFISAEYSRINVSDPLGGGASTLGVLGASVLFGFY